MDIITKQLILALDYTDSIIVMTDTDGNILYVNKTFEKKYGYSKEEALGQNPRILKTEFHPAKFYRKMWETITAGKTWQGVFHNRTKNGTLLWENAIISPVISDSGEITAFIAVKEDVTDFRKTISELESSNKRYYSLVEDAPVIICRFDPKGRFTYTNNQFNNTFKTSTSEIKGKYFFDILPEDIRDEISQNIFGLTVDSPIYEFQCNLKIDNKTRWYKSICRALYNSRNNIKEFQVVSMEFTQLKETEDALKENRNKLQAIINNRMVAIAVYDRNLDMVLFNDYFFEMFGFNSEKEAYRTDFHELTHPEYIEVTKKRIHALFSKEIDSYHITKKYVKRDGTAFWGDAFVSPIMSDSGEVVQIAGMIINSTARKAMEHQMKENEKALKKLNRTKDKLFSIIAHDIKNPFNVILGYSNLLSNNFDGFSREELKSFSDKILIAGENVYKLLDDLLVWAKSQMGQLKVVPEKIDLNKIGTDIVNHFGVMADQKNISIINNIPENTFAYADYEMIRFVVRNLVHNALKFTPENGKISMSYLPGKNGTCTFEVSDTGIGIRNEKLDTLFDMMDIMEDKNTNDGRGTGLGLHLSRDMIIKNNGSIDVRSTVGKGTTFTIKLPAYNE